MLVRKAYRYELDPNNHQKNSLLQHAGVVRFAYNWGLEQRIKLCRENHRADLYEAGTEHQSRTVMPGLV
ncbi:MAG: helix-turn-helix domain-containing protein [Candidatus Thorarchaeota archaeon SMTZ1-83]